MSVPTVLPPCPGPVRPAPARSPHAPAEARPNRFIRPALVRGTLYLTPVPLALAAREPLAAVPWQLPAGALVAGWCAWAALGSLARRPGLRRAALPQCGDGKGTAGWEPSPLAPGSRRAALPQCGDGKGTAGWESSPLAPGPRGWAAHRAGAGSAARLVLVGYAVVVAAWSVLLAVAPPELVGADRALAYAVSLPALVLLGAFTAGQVTDAEPALLRWSAPLLLVAAAGIAGGLPAPGLLARPEALLPVAIAVLAIRAFAPAVRPPARAGPSITRAGLRGCAAWLALGAGQAATVLLVWRVGHELTSAGGVPPGALPLLVAIPLIELWVGWHVVRLASGLARFGDRDRYLRFLRRLGWLTLVALLPPLVTGAALAATAARLPYRLSGHPDAPALMLAMSGGVLLAGVVAIGWLLSARGRVWLAAAITAAPVPVTLGLAASVPELAATSLEGWGQFLPATAIALAVAYAAGLLLTTYVLLDPRSLR